MDRSRSTFATPAIRKASRLLRAYHRHRVDGLDHVPLEGRCLVVVNHSFATYDIGLLVEAIERKTGRAARGLGDRALFSGPDEGRIANRFGVVLGNPDNATRLLEAEALLLVAPGGMREALRPSHERYRIRWQRRKGFVRLALTTGTPIMLAACPDADRLYRVYESKLTKAVYKHMRLPLPVLRGWGPTLVPRPVRLRHVLSEPIPPPDFGPDDLDDVVDAWHLRICDAMEELMVAARATRRGQARSLDRQRSTMS